MIKKTVEILGKLCYVSGETEEELEEDIRAAFFFMDRYHGDMMELSKHQRSIEAVRQLGKELNKVFGGTLYDTPETPAYKAYKEGLVTVATEDTIIKTTRKKDK